MTYEIERETGHDREIFTARATDTGESLAMGVFYPAERTARIWDQEAMNRGLRDQPERPHVLYGADVGSVLALVNQAARAATPDPKA